MINNCEVTGIDVTTDSTAAGEGFAASTIHSIQTVITSGNTGDGELGGRDRAETFHTRYVVTNVDVPEFENRFLSSPLNQASPDSFTDRGETAAVGEQFPPSY